MDEQLSEMLREWGERGPTLITAVLEERNRVLEIAAHQRDELSAELFETETKVGVLRDQAHELAQQYEEEQEQASASIRKLNTTVQTLTNDLEDAKNETERLTTQLKQVTSERDKAIRDIEEREKSTEQILAALQKSMHSEARAKTTAMDSIRNLEQENLQWSKLVGSERMRAAKESQRADAAEKQAIKLQTELDKLIAERKLEETERVSIARAEQSTVTSTTRTRGSAKRRKAVSSQPQHASSRVRSDSSDETQLHDDDIHTSEVHPSDRPAKKRMLSKQTDKRRRTSTEWKRRGTGRVEIESKHSNAPSAQKSRTSTKRKVKTCPTLERIIPGPDGEQQVSVSDQHVLMSAKRERPRRNVPKVSYFYPLQGNWDVQTRDKFCAPEPKTQRHSGS